MTATGLYARSAGTRREGTRTQWVVSLKSPAGFHHKVFESPTAEQDAEAFAREHGWEPNA